MAEISHYPNYLEVPFTDFASLGHVQGKCILDLGLLLTIQSRTESYKYLQKRMAISHWERGEFGSRNCTGMCKG